MQVYFFVFIRRQTKKKVFFHVVATVDIYIYERSSLRMHTRDGVHRVSTCSVKWAGRRDGRKKESVSRAQGN